MIKIFAEQKNQHFVNMIELSDILKYYFRPINLLFDILFQNMKHCVPYTLIFLSRYKPKKVINFIKFSQSSYYNVRGNLVKKS